MFTEDAKGIDGPGPGSTPSVDEQITAKLQQSIEAADKGDTKAKDRLVAETMALREQKEAAGKAEHQQAGQEQAEEPTKPTLRVPDNLTEEQAATIAPVVAELGKLAGSLPGVELQRGVNLVAQLETVEAPGTAYDSLDSGHVALVRQHGPDGAKQIMGQAMKAAAVLPDSLVAYLETSGLGYRPSVLVALAGFAGDYFKNTPASAKAKLQGKDLSKLQQHIYGLIAAEE